MKTWNTLGLLFGLTVGGLGCNDMTESDSEMETFTPGSDTSNNEWSDTEWSDNDRDEDGQEETSDTYGIESGCNGHFISAEAAEEMYYLTQISDNETIYTTYDRIDGIATLFEACGDPWGMFPTTYRHITNRIIEAIEDKEIEDTQWGKDIVLDFASRYFDNLQKALTNDEPSYAWAQYYYLADQDDVSRTRAVVVAMVAHLTLDLPYAMVEIGTTEDHEDDYFVLGELMIEITPDFLDELLYYYDTDAEDILNGFFFGNWVDGSFGEDTTITLSYQTIRTKSWNNRWYLEQWWGVLIAETEIYTSFWTIDGVLATLDAAGTI